MAQFDLYARSRSKRYPFVVDLQSDLLRDLATRVVAPLTPLKQVAKPLSRLNPIVKIGSTRYVVLFPELAAMPLRALDDPVGSLADHRDDLVGALDLLFTGV
jgi:toxin CcdB